MIQDPRETKKAKSNSRTDDLIFGMILVGVGAVVLLGRQGLLEENLLGTFWPLIIAAFGVGDLLAGRLGKGFLMITIGTSLFASIHGYVDFDDLWPLLMIVAGACVLFGAFDQRSRRIETHTRHQPEES